MRSSSKLNLDFKAWVEANLTVETCSGNEWICVCPKCGRSKLAVNVQKKAWQCWVCKFAGRRPVGLISATLGLNFEETQSYLTTGALTLASGRIEPLHKPKEKRGVLPKAPVPPGTEPLQGDTKKYARSRGISDENCGLFGLSSISGDGSCSIADRLLSGRLLIPAYDLRNRLVYWVARATDAHHIKTVNLPRETRHVAWGLDHVPGCATRSEVVIGLHAVLPGSRVIVVEGPMDVAVCGPGFVATLGASLSVEQAFLIASSGAREAVILYDPDEAGVTGAIAARKRLGTLIPTRVAQCPAGFDPADLGRAEVLRLIDETQVSEPVASLARPTRFRATRVRRFERSISPLNCPQIKFGDNDV